jgi:ribosome-associated heat shock protein Hsp15
MPSPEPLARQRIDKWLWAARFFKTRSLAADEIGKGRVAVNGSAARASREVKPGDMVQLRQGAVHRTVVVQGLSHQRGPAPVAALLYQETPESQLARQQAADQRRLAPEPASSLIHGRPTKRDRRDAERVHTWNERWSASVDD